MFFRNGIQRGKGFIENADPATLQIKRACNELEPTDTFPLKLYAEIVSNVILYRDTHIEIKLRNGQIL